MNTNYKCPFIINLICAILLYLAPSYVFATPSVIEEIEHSVFQEEARTINHPENIEQLDFTTDDTEISTSNDEIKPIYAPDNYYDNLPKPSEEDFTYNRKYILDKAPQKHSRLYKIFRKLLKITNLNKNYIVLSMKNKLNLFEHFTTRYRTITTLDFAPYYSIMPEIPDDYLKKMVFYNDITNIIELLPYSLTMLKDTIYKMNPPKNIVTPQGTTNMLVLINAPSPHIKILGKSHFAKLVIDIRNNTLYKYDKSGFPLKAYLVATGARGTRTRAGLRIVTYKERFPYSSDPTSLRAQDPFPYGPYIIFVNVIDPKTGKQSVIQQLLHGNGSEYSIGKKVSHGCVRTNNSVMKYELSKEIKRGDYILLINPDID